MTVAQVLNLDELEDALQKAKEDAEAADVALQNVTEDTPEDLLVDLDARYQASLAEVTKLAKAIERKEKMNDALASVPRPKDEKDKPKYVGKITDEPRTYRRGQPFSQSFLHDVFHVNYGDPGAAARLARHAQETRIDMGIDAQYAMTTGAGSGVGFVPPQFLQEDWAAALRGARPLADAIGSRELPDVGTTFNLPRITTGGTAAVQATEGGAIQDNSQVTDTIAIPVSTIAAKTDMSRQLFDRSQPGMDDVIMADLSADYARAVDSEIINGPGSGGRVKGILTAAAANTIAVSTLTVPGTYPKVADAIQRVDTQRFLPADLIVYHPRRWGQWLAGLDTQSRPFIVPAPVAFNPAAVGNEAGIANSQGYTGYEVQGLPALKDPNVPTNLGAGTNEDRIIVTRKEDLYLWESGAPVVRAYEEVLSGTLQVRIQVFGYIAFTAERVVGAVSTWLLTGLTPPTF